MTFIPLKSALNDWLEKKKYKKGIIEVKTSTIKQRKKRKKS